MSVLNNINVNGRFTGITANKGEILANDGTSNNAFPISTDGYILSADSSQAFGLRWIPNSGGGGGGPVMTTEINITPFNFSTNSTIPVVIPNTQQTGLSANILFIGTINCMLNHARHNFTIGLYKNGALISGTQKTGGGINSVSFPISIHQTIALIVSDIFDIRINVDSISCEVAVVGINPYNDSAFINESSVISTNSVVPYILSDFTFTGASGIIALIINLNCVVDHAYAMFSVGIYKNGILVQNSGGIFGGADVLIFPIQLNIVLDLVVLDVITICINSNSTSNMVSVFERTLLRTAYTSGMSIVPQISITNSMLGITDMAPYTIPDMNVSGLTSGNYIFIGELNCMLNHARGYFYVGLYKNGTLIGGSQKKYGGIDNVRQQIPFLTSIAMTPSDTFSVAVWLNSAGYQLNIYERSLTHIST